MKKTIANIMAVALWSVAASATEPEFPSYTQRVTATFANEVEAANAEVSIAPLPGGARYAFFPPSWHNVFTVVMAPPPWANGRTVVTGDRVSLGSPTTDLNKVSGEVRTCILSVDYVEDGVVRRVYSIICKSDTVRE